MGFLRLATNPKVLPGYTLSMTDAWTVYERIFSDERVVFAEEAANIEVVWKRFTQQTTFSTNVWTDAYLAAFAQTAVFPLHDEHPCPSPADSTDVAVVRNA
jgi:predicted nucleic acid-binding protein